MLSETNVAFLQEKISDLKSALFFSLGDTVLKMPTTIVNALKVDDVGQIWFFVTRPMQNIQEFDREFPAQLDFFKKGKNFYLKVMGKACIVNDPEEVNGLVSVSEEVKSKAMSGLVLMKVKIHNINYVDKTPGETNGRLQSLKSLFNRWFGSQPSFRPYSMQPAHS